MNKELWKRKLERTCINTSQIVVARDDDYKKVWMKSLAAVGLTWRVNEKMELLVTDLPGGTWAVFNFDFVKDFPTLEKFVADGGELRKGDYISLTDGNLHCVTEGDLHSIEGCSKLHVVYAQCWVNHPHQYANIIKAKADNVGLVVLWKGKKGSREWTVDEQNTGETLLFNAVNDYFACLSKHVDAVLSLLNANSNKVVQVRHGSADDWFNITLDTDWFYGPWYMQEDWDSRVVEPITDRWLIQYPDGSESVSKTEPKTGEGIACYHFDFNPSCCPYIKS